MSGGSLEYVYERVSAAADEIACRCRSPLHLAFVAHLRKVSKALHDVEWVLSADYGEGDDAAAIRAVLHPADELLAAGAAARAARDDLEAALKRLEGA